MLFNLRGGVRPGAPPACDPVSRHGTICPFQRIDVQASCPCLNKIPFQFLQHFANHKTNSCGMTVFLMSRKNQTRTLRDFGTCSAKRAKGTSRRPAPLSLRRYRRLPGTTSAPVAQPPSRLLQCASVVCLVTLRECSSVQRPPISAVRRFGNTGAHKPSPLFRCIFHYRYTEGSDFPHSRQNSFERHVINRKPGTFLVIRKQATCGFSLIKRADALKFRNE
jgi:hypothetical protein